MSDILPLFNPEKDLSVFVAVLRNDHADRVLVGVSLVKQDRVSVQLFVPDDKKQKLRQIARGMMLRFPEPVTQFSTPLRDTRFIIRDLQYSGTCGQDNGLEDSAIAVCSVLTSIALILMNSRLLPGREAIGIDWGGNQADQPNIFDQYVATDLGFQLVTDESNSKIIAGICPEPYQLRDKSKEAIRSMTEFETVPPELEVLLEAMAQSGQIGAAIFSITPLAVAALCL